MLVCTLALALPTLALLCLRSLTPLSPPSIMSSTRSTIFQKSPSPRSASASSPKLGSVPAPSGAAPSSSLTAAISPASPSSLASYSADAPLAPLALFLPRGPQGRLGDDPVAGANASRH